jgi:acyl-CoA synthetase (AMP-forming)/AMP-acid ligase II
VDLSTWRVALCGAEPVVPRVLRRFSDRFAAWGFDDRALTPVYGLSEAALAVTFSDLYRPFVSRHFDRDRLRSEGHAVETDAGVELTSVGKALEGFTVRIVDGEGHQQSDGHIGEVEVRGPSLMEGYLDRPEETRKVIQNEWLKTGDLGFIHGGELFISGRAKDVLILRGQNHDPAELEDAVNSVERIRSGCAVAASWLPPDADGEVLVLIVEARAGVPMSQYASLAKACSAAVVARTSLLPDHVEIVSPGTLPRTSSGKKRRAEALDRFLEGRLGPPTPVTPVSMLGAVARSSLDFARFRWHERD